MSKEEKQAEVAAQEAAAAKEKEAETKAAESKSQEVDHAKEVEAIKEKLGKTEKRLGQAEYKLDEKRREEAKHKAEAEAGREDEPDGLDLTELEQRLKAEQDEKLSEITKGLMSNVVEEELSKLGESADEREHIKLIYNSSFASSVGTDRAAISEALSNAYLIANKSRFVNNTQEAAAAQKAAGHVDTTGTSNAGTGDGVQDETAKLEATSDKYSDSLPAGYRD